MNRLLPAPTGHHAIAQGNALGAWDIRPTNFPSPERATWFARERMDRHAMFRPFSFHRAPRWGFEPFGGTPIEPFGDTPMNRVLLAPMGHYAIAQGNALDSEGA